MKDKTLETDNETLKKQFFDRMLKRALGFEYEETQTIIEETKTGTKKRITKYKKQSLPDVQAMLYLLIKMENKEVE